MVHVTKSWRWVLLVSVVVAFAGCGSSLANRSVSPTAPVTIHIHLDHAWATAGESIKGIAVLTNSTSKVITVQQCAADGWIEVGVVNKQIRFEPAMEMVACPPTVQLRPGVNRFPITVMTTYQECQQSDGQSNPNLPACTPKGQPPLPAGTYTTEVVTYGLPRSTPKPQTIQVTLTPV
jgi:hypothetical protein